MSCRCAGVSGGQPVRVQQQHLSRFAPEPLPSDSPKVPTRLDQVLDVGVGDLRGAQGIAPSYGQFVGPGQHPFGVVDRHVRVPISQPGDRPRDRVTDRRRTPLVQIGKAEPADRVPGQRAQPVVAFADIGQPLRRVGAVEVLVIVRVISELEPGLAPAADRSAVGEQVAAGDESDGRYVPGGELADQTVGALQNRRAPDSVGAPGPRQIVEGDREGDALAEIEARLTAAREQKRGQARYQERDRPREQAREHRPGPWSLRPQSLRPISSIRSTATSAFFLSSSSR